MARWVYAKPYSDSYRGPQGVPPAVMQILHELGVHDPLEMEDFLSPFPKLTHDPFLLDDAEAAAERILSAADSDETICIYGDYDVDGVTAVTLLLCMLRGMTDRVQYYIPSRFDEGYGLSREAIRILAGRGVDLIVTVDCGSTAIEEVAYAGELGVEIIVTDHHSPTPDAEPDCLFVNPKRRGSAYPFPHLSGCGVAFKLAQVVQRLLERRGDERFAKSDLNGLLDLVAISTVADVVPLLDENRTIVKYGLSLIHERRRRGLAALLEVLDFGGKRIDADHIAYLLAPNINAQGRMDSADIGVELLCGCDLPDAELQNLARTMAQSNRDRKSVQSKAHRYCTDIIDRGASGEWFPIIYAPDAHEGVAGIVAGQLKEMLYRPVFIVTDAEEGLVKGTGRSVPGIDLHALLSEVPELFVRYGGHAGACGFTMQKEKLDSFREQMQRAVKERADAEPDLLTEELYIAKVLEPCEKDLAFVEQLGLLEPHGERNPKPLFSTGPGRIESLFYMGADEEHVRFTVRAEDDVPLPCVLFRRAQDYAPLLKSGELVDVALELGINEYRGQRRVQGVVKDIRRGEQS